MRHAAVLPVVLFVRECISQPLFKLDMSLDGPMEVLEALNRINGGMRQAVTSEGSSIEIVEELAPSN